MGCNNCEKTFQETQNVVVSIEKDGSDITLFVQNNGQNVILIRRIILCFTSPSGAGSVMYLRPPPDGIPWDYPSSFLEPGITGGFFTVNSVSGYIVQAQAEYIEIEGRSRSCAVTV